MLIVFVRGQSITARAAEDGSWKTPLILISHCVKSPPWPTNSRTPFRNGRPRPGTITGASSAHGDVSAIHCPLRRRPRRPPVGDPADDGMPAREPLRRPGLQVRGVRAFLREHLQRHARGRSRPRRDGLPCGLLGVGREAVRAVRQGRLVPVDVEEELQVNVAEAVVVPRPDPDPRRPGSLEQRPVLDPPLLTCQFSEASPGEFQHPVIRQRRWCASPNKRHAANSLANALPGVPVSMAADSSGILPTPVLIVRVGPAEPGALPGGTAATAPACKPGIPHGGSSPPRRTGQTHGTGRS